MRSMRNSVMKSIEERILETMGDMAVKITDNSNSKCLWFGAYESDFPIELIDIEKNSEE